MTAVKGGAAELQMGTKRKDIAAESFGIDKNQVYHGGTPKIPIIDHFVPGVLAGTACKTTAPAEILKLKEDGQASFNKPAILDIVRQQLFKGGVRLAAILNSL